MVLSEEGPEARPAGPPGALRIAVEGEVGPRQGYLLNSQDSTVQESGWGEGTSPRSLSCGSSQSRLPEGRRNFTKA